MPNYDYKCRTCENKATIMTSIKDEIKLPICAACKAEMVRDYGVLGVSFKGGGFYSVDSRGQSSNSAG
jgi:putative FmdB family regulatory protein